MLDLATIEYESNQQARKAARQKAQPLAITKQDLATDANFAGLSGFTSLIPWLGKPRRTRLWTPVAVCDLLDYPYKWFFADSMGIGGGGGDALGTAAFRKLLVDLCAKHGYKFALGVAEVGQFQVQIALYERVVVKHG